MRAEIIIVGDEILEGLIAEANAQYLCAVLSEWGFRPRRIITVGDDLEAIVEALKDSFSRSDLVIVTGGLGPTPDDLTREAAARAFGLPLRRHEGYLEQIRKKFQERNLPFTEAEEAFALLPQGAKILPNPVGLCGFKLEIDGRHLFFLPGVPKEVRATVQVSLLPFLQGAGVRGMVQRVIKCFGLTEGQAKELLRDLRGPFKIAYLPHLPELHIKVRVEASCQREAQGILQDVVDEIRRRLGINAFGMDEDTLEGVLGGLLKERGFTLAVAESCTGGLVAHRITQVPGSSEYFLGGVVSYSNESKERELGVPGEVIRVHGAVSAECASAMAEGVRLRFGSTFGISTTGIAGPAGGTPEKPVGTVFIALDAETHKEVKGYRFFGDRDQIKLMASEVALDRLRRFLLRNPGFKP